MNAIKQLKDFSTVQNRYRQEHINLLGDAYSELGKNEDALDYYKKAAHHFEKDESNSAEALFLAAYLSDQRAEKSKRSNRII